MQNFGRNIENDPYQTGAGTNYDANMMIGTAN